MKLTLIAPALAAVLLLPGVSALAAETAAAPKQVQAQAQEQVYGSQLMSRKERAAYRAKMRAAQTAEEREQIRREHHEQMKERAKARGVILPDEPPARGQGMGPGSGMGPGGMRNR